MTVTQVIEATDRQTDIIVMDDGDKRHIIRLTLNDNQWAAKCDNSASTGGYIRKQEDNMSRLSKIDHGITEYRMVLRLERNNGQTVNEAIIPISLQDGLTAFADCTEATASYAPFVVQGPQPCIDCGEPAYVGAMCQVCRALLTAELDRAQGK